MKRNSCKCSNRRNSLKNLISDYKNLHTEQKTLQKKQTAYLALAQAADEQLQAYTRMQRAFLDAQAGILAGSLQAGIPCPVCGSVEHPRPAVLSEHAPTEEQVKCELGCTVVGFENHSGKTYLSDGVKPIGKVLAGFGNNGEDGFEGARYKNVFATYSHGCLLPKNPQIADFVLKTALERKYGALELKPLDNALEIAAHDYMQKRLSEK